MGMIVQLSLMHTTLEQLQNERVIEIQFVPVLFPIIEGRNLANLSKHFQVRLYC
jgi:hypothetical protein